MFPVQRWNTFFLEIACRTLIKDWKWEAGKLIPQLTFYPLKIFAQKRTTINYIGVLGMYFSLIFNSQKDNLGLYWLHSSCKNSCENHPSTSHKFFKSSHQLFCTSRKRSNKIFTTGSLRLTKDFTGQREERGEGA